MLGSLAILGMPPFGVFASEFLILTSAMRQLPWAAPLLLLALAVAFAAVLTHLGLGLALGLFIPPFLANWYMRAATLIGG